MLIAAALAFNLLANDDHDLDLAAALARRGWVELAEELCDRIERNPGASASAKEGVPLVLAEVAIAKARGAVDALKAAKDLDLAVARLRRAGRVPTLDERGMTGWLHVQKARILSAAAEEDAARRADAIQAWEATEAFYRSSLAELQAMPTSRPVDEALLETRLELPKALSSLARVASVDPSRAKKLHEEAIAMLADFGFNAPQPIVLEALLEEARSRADAGDLARAEMRYRSMPGLARDLRKRGFPASEYMTSLLQSGVLGLARTLTQAKKLKEAITTCDDFLRDNPRLSRSPIGFAVVLAKADALQRLDEKAAIQLVQNVSAQDPGGAAGRAAREKLRKWLTSQNATPDRLMLVADGLIELGQNREALVELRRCVEVCGTAAERARWEPVASFKRGECFRALRQDAEAAAAFQEVFRKHPAHELAKRAAIEAVGALSRMASATGDKRDEDQMEKLLDEIERLGLQGEAGPILKFIRAQILERKKQFKAAADLYGQVDEGCEVYDDAMVAAGHCYRLDAEQRPREDVAKHLATAEALLRKVLARKETHRVDPRLLFTARYELAMVCLHAQMNRPKDALDHLRACESLLPADNPLTARLRESEIQALLLSKDVTGAAGVLDSLMTRFPDAIQTLRACRKVALWLETTDPAKAAQYYRFWLAHSSGLSIPAAEVQTVADGLYRAARKANAMDEKAHSILDLRGKPVADRALWQEAARAHEMLIQAGVPEKDAAVAATRLVWCTGLSAQTAADWDKSKLLCEKIIQDHQLLQKNGAINPATLAQKRWLAEIYLEYGHALYQLGKAGQKYQFGNGLTVFNQLLEAAPKGSETWWIARYYSVRSYFERGEGRDLQSADSVLNLLAGDRPEYDEGNFGFRDLFVELRNQVRAVLGRQR
jgi:hypothetical protein